MLKNFSKNSAIFILVILCSLLAGYYGLQMQEVIAAESEDYLLAHFMFNGDLEDTTGNFEAGKVTGNRINNILEGREANYAATENGQALVLDSRSGVRLADNLIENDRFTVSFWMHAERFTHHTTIFFGAVDSENWISLVPERWGHEMLSLWAGLPSGGHYNNASTQVELPAKHWKHIAFTVDKGDVSLFVDGILEYEGSDYPAVFDNADQSYFALGVNHWDTPFQGMIDDLRIYNRALSSESIKSIIEQAEYEIIQASGLFAREKNFTGETSLTLAWDEYQDASYYNVYRKLEGNISFEKIASTEVAEYLDETVEIDSRYKYAVSIVISDTVETTMSDSILITMQDEGVTRPDAPSDLSLVDIEEYAIDLSWSDVEDALLYYVYRARRLDRDGNIIDYEKIAETSSNHYRDEIVTSIPYYYKIVAVNAGGISADSEVIETSIEKVYYRQMENINRGLVAVKIEDGVYLGWRMFGYEPDSIAFNLYRDGEKVNNELISSSTNYIDTEGNLEANYYVKAIINGEEQEASETVTVWAEQYMDIPIQRPEGGRTPDGVRYVYHANDASVADLTGDGNYEIILKWDPSNSKDNSHAGYTGNVYIDAYTLDGTKLWRIDLGRNIRAGAHYTQFLVYDFDGNGRAEMVVKTADGTTDAAGTVIGDPEADWRNRNGYILAGPEYLTVFDGLTGTILETTDYYPPRGNVATWGDNYGNRVDRFLAGVAYLDGERPSFIMARGYYTRTVLAAYDWRDGQIQERWIFDSDDPGNEAYAGQGNHSLIIADVDGNGYDEIVYGSMVLNSDGTGRWTSGLGHGDAAHLSNFDPSRPGLEIFQVHEWVTSPVGVEFADADTGELIFGEWTGTDVGRGLAADIDPRFPGAEVWAVNEHWQDSHGNFLSAQGEKIIPEDHPKAGQIPQSINFAIWWDGDLLRELLDHNWYGNYGIGKIDKWDYENYELVNILTAEGTRSNNWTKGNPVIQADLLGDWREEVIWRTEDSSALRVYTTTDLTEHRIYTLMHDPQYRLAIAWQNVAYNQPPHPSFFIGHGMPEPLKPNMYWIGEDGSKVFPDMY
ncbi:rhamnogalacturonan lyase family protein [Natronospora cellulosivora (SeqCode)]